MTGSYPDEALTLMVRLEQLARTADKDLAKIFKEMQWELIETMDMVDRINSHIKMKKVKAKLNKIATARHAEIMERLSEYSATAVDAAIKVEESGLIGSNSSAATADILTDAVVAKSLDRNMPGLPSGRQISIGGMLDKFTSNGAVYASNVANKAMIEGLSTDQAARELRNVVDVSKRDSRTMVRTAINGAANQARDDIAERLPVNKYLWLATLDSKTCPYCSGQDGRCRSTESKGTPKPLAHPNCRCVILYVPEGTSCKEMKDDMERPQRGPDGKSTRNTKYKEYGEWIKTQPKDFQVEILGKKRYELLRDGKLTFKQMYLRNGSRMTIEDIQKKYEITPPKPKLVVKPKPTYYNINSITSLGPDSSGKAFGAGAHTAKARKFAKGLSPEMQAPYHEYFLDSDPGYALTSAGSSGASYSFNKQRIKIHVSKAGKVDQGTVFIHEFGHRTDHKYARLVQNNEKWGQSNTYIPGTPFVSHSGRWDKALREDRLHLDAVDSKSNKMLPGDSEIGDKRKELDSRMKGLGITKVSDQIEWLKKQHIDDKFVYLSEMVDDLKDDLDMVGLASNSIYIKYAELAEHTMRKSLILATETKAEIFIIKDFISAGTNFYNSSKVSNKFLYMADAMGGTTKNKFGKGHPHDYYASNPSYGHLESFANIFALAGDKKAGKFLSEYLPNQVGAFEDFLRLVEDFEND